MSAKFPRGGEQTHSQPSVYLKEDDIARVLNVSPRVVSRPLKEHREREAVFEKRKRSTSILEYTELLLKHYGTWCFIWRPQDTVTGPLNSGVRPPLDSLDGQNMVLRDYFARPHCTRVIEEYKNQHNIASLPRPSLLLDLDSQGVVMIVYLE